MATSEQPKKAGNPYFLFMKDNREAIRKQLGEQAKGKGVVLKAVAEQWNGLSKEAKATYERRAADGKAEYEKAAEKFKADGGQIVRKRKADKEQKPRKDKNAPKKPSCGGYGVYLAEHRREIVKSLPAGSNAITDVQKAARAQWTALAKVEKKKYESKFASKMKEYAALMEASKAGNNIAAEDESSDPDDPLKKKEASSKKLRVTDPALMAEVQLRNLTRQFRALSENPKMASIPASKILEVLISSNGSAVVAKKALLGG